MKCCVPYCMHLSENIISKTEKVTFHEFPTTQNLRHSWLESIGINESHLTEGVVVCSQHFHKEDFHVTNCGTIELKNNSVPSIIRHKRNSVSSAAQVCMICLDTGCKLCPFTQYLIKAYCNITGLPKSPIFEINSEPKLCTECVQRLTNCNKFRDKSLAAHNILSLFYKKYGMLTLENIATINSVEYQLRSNIVKHTSKPDHSDFYFKDNIEQNKNAQEQNTSITDQYPEVKVEINADIIIDSKVKEESLDFDIHYETDCDLDDRLKNAVTKNKVSKGNSNTDVKYLDDDIDHDMDFINEYDNCVKILKENIRKEEDTKNIINTVATVINKKNKASPNKCTFNLINVKHIKDTKPKILNSRKSIKPIKYGAKFAKINKKISSKMDKIRLNVKKHRTKCAKINSDVIKTRKIVVKPKTQDCGELKMFTVNVLSYEEQLADVQKRKDTVSYMRSPYKCTICYKGYWYTNPYSRHMEKHTDKYGQLVCAICGLHMKTRRKLVTHIKINHDVQFSCMKCPFTSNNRSQAQAHEQWHNGKKYRCPHCDVEFAKRSSYLSHVRIKHPSDCVCALCGFSFVSEKGLQCHMNMTHRFDDTQNPSGPTCEECDIRFASVTAYEQHMKVSPKHAAEDALKRNEPLHKTKRRPLYPNRKEQGDGDAAVAILCELCGKSFRWPALLRQHMQVHTGEKRFKCDICDKRFMHKLSLTLHSESHSDNPARYECGVCGKSFTNHSNRLRHMLLHRDARTYYKCDVCDKDFTTAQGRNAHVSHVHSNVPRPKRVRSSRAGAVGTRAAETSDSQDS